MENVKLQSIINRQKAVLFVLLFAVITVAILLLMVLFKLFLKTPVPPQNGATVETKEWAKSVDEGKINSKDNTVEIRYIYGDYILEDSEFEGSKLRANWDNRGMHFYVGGAYLTPYITDFKDPKHNLTANNPSVEPERNWFLVVEVNNSNETGISKVFSTGNYLNYLRLSHNEKLIEPIRDDETLVLDPWEEGRKSLVIFAVDKGLKEIDLLSGDLTSPNVAHLDFFSDNVEIYQANFFVKTGLVYHFPISKETFIPPDHMTVLRDGKIALAHPNGWKIKKFYEAYKKEDKSFVLSGEDKTGISQKAVGGDAAYSLVIYGDQKISNPSLLNWELFVEEEQPILLNLDDGIYLQVDEAAYFVYFLHPQLWAEALTQTKNPKLEIDGIITPIATRKLKRGDQAIITQYALFPLYTSNKTFIVRIYYQDKEDRFNKNLADDVFKSLRFEQSFWGRITARDAEQLFKKGGLTIDNLRKQKDVNLFAPSFKNYFSFE